MLLYAILVAPDSLQYNVLCRGKMALSVWKRALDITGLLGGKRMGVLERHGCDWTVPITVA